MAICEICYGTGKIEGVGFCGCGHGMMRKAEVEKKTQISQHRKSVAFKEITGLNIDKPLNNKNPLYQEGDWVEIDSKVTLGVKGIKGFVVEPMKFGVRVQTVGIYKHGLRDGIIRLYNEQVFPAFKEKGVPMDLIDLALQTKDEEWFKQLTRGME